MATCTPHDGIRNGKCILVFLGLHRLGNRVDYTSCEAYLINIGRNRGYQS